MKSGGKKSRGPSAQAPRARAKTKGSKSPRASWALRLLVVAVFFASLAVLGFVSLLAYYGRDLPTVDKLKRYEPPQISRVLDRHGKLIAESFSERRTVVPMSRVPRALVLSVLAAEDADFYRHRGLDYAGIARAVVTDVLRGRPTQGASTITQQIVKNLLLTPERTIERKVRELILARRLEQELDKDQILFLYLNHINFGHGRYGVEEASRFYFDKHVQDLTLAEASLIAGIPQSPARLSPFTHPEAARRRQLYVLGQLERKRAQYWDDLPQSAIDEARRAEAQLRKQGRSEDSSAPEVAMLAREMLVEIVGEEVAKRGGYTIETTLDLSVQGAAREALQKGLTRVDERQRHVAPFKAPKTAAKVARVKSLSVGKTYDALVHAPADESGTLVLDIGGQRATMELSDARRWNPKGLRGRAFAEPGSRFRVTVTDAGDATTQASVRPALGPEGALVVIDPRSRDVLALVGGYSASYGFNRASHAVRQPGSTWKPLAYALGLETRAFTPASVVLDAPEVYDEWQPNNYETWRYAGAVRLREALAQSINLVAVRVTAELGPANVVSFARKLGITSELDPSLALSLGASGVRPIELVNAYATFAAGGRFLAPRIVKRIVDPAGKELKLPKRAAPVQAMSAEGAYLITSMLESVVQTGTGKSARVLNRPIAGKTGTSNRARDAWFVGYTPELVAGVWVGYDDVEPLGRGETGGTTALPIWIDVMKEMTGNRPAVSFPVPRGIVRAKIDPKTGKLAYEDQADAIDEVFLEGTLPTEMATPPDLVDTDTFMMEQLGLGSAAP